MILQIIALTRFHARSQPSPETHEVLPMEAVMEHLFFVCPATRREVDSGIETEIGTLLRIREQHLRAFCPACGEWHQWPVRDAALAKAA
jgi:hypothetical protein